MEHLGAYESSATKRARRANRAAAIILLAASLTGLASLAACAGSVTVLEPSFQTVGASQGSGWYSFPVGNPWGVDPAALYRILDQGIGHFDTAPDGNRAANLSLVTQDLQTNVGYNAQVVLTFYLGRSKYAPYTGPATAAVWMAVSGQAFASNQYLNGTVQGAFTSYALTGNTALAVGSLSITLRNTGGTIFLDKVGVTFTPGPPPPPMVA